VLQAAGQVFASRYLYSLSAAAVTSRPATKYNGIHAVPFSLTEKEAISAFREQQGSVPLGADTSNVKLRAKAILLPFLCYDVSVTTTAAGRCGWERSTSYTDAKGNVRNDIRTDWYDIGSPVLPDIRYRAGDEVQLQIYAGFDHCRTSAWCARGPHINTARQLRPAELSIV
jgi:hypothetical protein